MTPEQRSALAAMLAAVLPDNRFYLSKLGDVAFDPASDPIDTLPFTLREELQEDQRSHQPYGTNLTYPIDRYTRYHQTSGTSGQPLRWLDTLESWQWFTDCWQQVLQAAGITETDRAVFPFSFGPFIGFWGAFEAAARMGCLCLPAGGMSSAARLDYIRDNQVTLLCCTPTYALRLAEVAADTGHNLDDSSVRAIIVAGEPGGSIAETRSRIETAWSARVFDHAGMTELGAWGFECAEAPGRLHINEQQFIVEVIDPDTQTPLPENMRGELVLTNLGRWASPLIRYRTGDLAILSRDPCPCGRRFAWLKGGILGRSDDMITIRGNNVFPSAIEGILRSFTEVAEFQLELSQRGPVDELVIRVEPAVDSATHDLEKRIAERVRDTLHFGVRVQLCPPESLPRYEMKARRFVRRTGT